MNRMIYADVISMSALKESGAIEYTADVCLGLQHANMEQIKTGTSTGKAEKNIRQMKEKSERDMEIDILKNRNGKIGEELSFSYYAMFHHFKIDEEPTTVTKTDCVFGNGKIKNVKSVWKLADKSSLMRGGVKMSVSVEISPTILAWVGQQISAKNDTQITLFLSRWMNKEVVSSRLCK